MYFFLSLKMPTLKKKKVHANDLAMARHVTWNPSLLSLDWV